MTEEFKVGMLALIESKKIQLKKSNKKQGINRSAEKKKSTIGSPSKQAELLKSKVLENLHNRVEQEKSR